jgi:uncharacterized membrane protein
MQEMVDTGRLEAFSDGVFAVAITLLVFDLNASTGSGPLLQHLLAQWPGYMAFLVSFFMIGIMWLNHHSMFHDIHQADRGLLIANLALLLVVTIIPFPTKVVADAFQTGSAADRRTAVLFYGLAFLTVSIMFNVLWLWAARDRRLIEPSVQQVGLDVRTRRSLFGIPAYTVATLLALASPVLSLAAEGALSLVYLIPGNWVDQLLVPEVRSKLYSPRDTEGAADPP